MSFPISITWSGGAPPVAGFDQMATAAKNLDSALTSSAGKFNQFGSTISQLESPIGGVAQGMEGLGNSLGTVEGAIGGAASGMTEFSSSTTELNGAISETGGFITDASSSMGELSSSTTETGGAMTELSGTTGEFNGTISETGGFVTEAGTGMTSLGTATTETVTPMTDLNTATTETNTALGESVTALGDVVPGLEDTAKGSEDSAQGFSDLAPKVDETNTALDSSSGLLSGVAPLLAETGTNAGDAATTTGDFSGAMAGLGEELGPVNGGLTDSNTLVNTLGTESDTTGGKTDDLKGSMAALGFGITTLVSSGMSLIGAFTNIRDAGFKVEASNMRVEKASVAVDKAFFGLGKSLNKLATDSEAPIKGMAALQTAFGNFVKLLQAGVTSGPAYKKALDDLKVAADGLEGSTNKDNEAIRAWQLQLDGAIPKVSKLDLETRKNVKAQEAQTKAFIDAGLQVAAFAGGIGSTVQTISVMKTSAGGISAALGTLGSTISTTVLPALASIAVPVGIAVGAFAAFVGATLLIRQNIGVFDQLGVKIGQVFPELKDELEGTRQAFINMSDGLNTAIGMMLQGIDSLSGGTTNMAEQWAGFTDTLPKGTGEIGNAGKATQGLGLVMMSTADKTKIGYGAFKVLGDTLVATGRDIVVTGDNWRYLDDKTVEFASTAAMTKAEAAALGIAIGETGTAATTAAKATEGITAANRNALTSYSDMTNAQKLNKASLNEVIQGLSDEKLERYNSIKAAENYLIAHGQTAAALGLSGDKLIGYVNALKKEAPAYSTSVQEATEYLTLKHKEINIRNLSNDQVIETANRLKEEDKALGKVTDTTSKHAKELENLNQALADNSAELAFYADANQMANRMQLEFNLGVQDAELKLNKRTFALARGAGELERNIELLNEGKLLEVAYGEGVLAAGQAIVKKSEALANAIGQYDETNRLIEEENLLLLDMQTGYQEARTAVQAHTEAIANGVGALAAWNDEATRTQGVANAVAQGWLDARTELQDMATEALNAVGAIASMRQELSESGSATIRFNQGLVQGTKSALEWAVGLARAAGEALGFRAEVLSVADDVGFAMQDMSHLSTEAIQNIIEVAAGIPEAFEETLSGLESFKDNFISILTKAGEEGKVNVMENIDELEEDLNTRFSEPLKEKIKLEADREMVNKDIEKLMGMLATTLSNNPLRVEADTLPAQGAINELIKRIDAAGASASHLQPLRAALLGLSQVDMTNIHEFAPALARVVQEAKAAGEPFAGLMAKFQELGPLADMTVSELDSVSQAFKMMGLNLDTTTGKITDQTGVVRGEWGKWGVGAKGAETDVTAAMGGIGAAGDLARDMWARDMQIMFLAVDSFGKHAQTMAGTVSGAFSNLATNTHASMSTMAQGFMIVLAAFARMQSDSQRMASTVSGSFSNMSSNINNAFRTIDRPMSIFLAALRAFPGEAQRMSSTVSSAFQSMGSRVASVSTSMSSSLSKASSAMVSATGKARQLASAINALKSKTITITTRYVTVGRPGFARGGSFVTNSPTKVGGASVSEFGHAELVTVTPLQTPGREPVKGLADLLGKETEKKGRKAMAAAEEEEAKPAKAKEVVMMRETPIVITVDGREIARVVNKRIFEESDALV